jgi:GNAT superfamily N-acetyltransferase
MPTVEIIAPERTENIVDVLCDAFFDYPVMQFVLGPTGDYARRLRTLVGFFVAARSLRSEPMLGVEHQAGSLAGVAIISLPGERPSPPALIERREAVWLELGPAERQRYEAYGNACLRFRISQPHHHLNMIGVRHTHAGMGLGRQLLEAVYGLALADRDSRGVSLDTEKPGNVQLYEHCGWQVMGRAPVAPGLETWGMFRGK